MFISKFALLLNLINLNCILAWTKLSNEAAQPVSEQSGIDQASELILWPWEITPVDTAAH